MISFMESQELILQTSVKRSLSLVDVEIERAAGYFLARDLRSLVHTPSTDNSAMDGFLIQSQFAKSNTEFLVSGQFAAGDESVEIPTSQNPWAMRVMTGASVPRAFDAVVKIEDVETLVRGDQTWIRLKKAVVRGENIRPQGTDFAKDEIFLKQGMRMGPHEVMALASLGVSSIPCFSKPRVILISTGKEIVPHFQAEPKPWQVRNSNSPYLLSFLQELGCDVQFLGQCGDDPTEFTDLLRKSLGQKPDLVLSTGGVSMGQYDYVKDVLTQMQAHVLFHKVAIRPGKPLLFAEIAPGTVFFGLPGNPISTAVAVEFFIEPYLKGLRRVPRKVWPLAKVVGPLRQAEGLTCFYKASLQNISGEIQVQASRDQESYKIKPLIQDNAWMVLPASQKIKDGDLVQYKPFRGERNWL